MSFYNKLSKAARPGETTAGFSLTLLSSNDVNDQKRLNSGQLLLLRAIQRNAKKNIMSFVSTEYLGFTLVGETECVRLTFHNFIFHQLLFTRLRFDFES